MTIKKKGGQEKKGLFSRLFDRLDSKLEKESKESCGCCCSGKKCSK